MNKALFPIYYFIICVAIALPDGNIQAQSSKDPYAKRVEALFQDYDKPDTPGAAVAVVQNGKLILQKNFGMANLEHQIPIGAHTVFDLASVSKQFCGMAIAILIDQGKIAYGDDIRKYIPELPDFGSSITVGHLLHHTSGIRDWTSALSLAGWSFDDVISFDQILNMAYRQQALNFKPGAEYSYSNTGYNILAELVQRVTGQSFRQWTDENIFKPLGMKHTHFHDDHSELVPDRASGYYKTEDGTYHAAVNSLMALGSSSLFSTIEDMSKWVMNYKTAKVGGRAVIERMMTQGVLNNGEQIAYAFGISVSNYKGLKRISHGGSWASFRTYLLHFPERDFSVVVLMNYGEANSSRTAHAIADIYLSNHYKLKKDNAPASTAANVSVPSLAEMEEYVGTYRLGPAWYVEISLQGQQLMTTATQEASFPMTATSGDSFVVDGYGGRSIVFKKNDSGEVTHFEYNGMQCPRIELSPAPELGEYAGVYWSEELNTYYTIEVEGNKLMARHLHNGEIPLTPLPEKDEFLGSTWYMRSVKFVRDPDAKLRRLEVTQHRSRRQVFHKVSALDQLQSQRH